MASHDDLVWRVIVVLVLVSQLNYQYFSLPFQLLLLLWVYGLYEYQQDLFLLLLFSNNGPNVNDDTINKQNKERTKNSNISLKCIVVWRRIDWSLWQQTSMQTKGSTISQFDQFKNCLSASDYWILLNVSTQWQTCQSVIIQKFWFWCYCSIDSGANGSTNTSKTAI